MSISQRRGAWALFCSGIVLAVVCGVSAPAMALTPTISVVSPASGTYAITPSSSITIFGTNFQLGSTITVGSLSGATVAGSTASATVPFVFVSTTQVRFYWPNTGLAPGVYNVQVMNSPTESATLTGGFTVRAPQPTISSVSPNTETYAVSPSASITVFGTNFVVGATITISNPTISTVLSGQTVAGSTANATTPYVFVSSGQVKFYWPNTQLAPGSYTVEVTNPPTAGGVSGNSANSFTVSAPQPTVTSVSPATETYAISPSASVTIVGSNFVVGATITVGSLSGVTVAGSTASAATPFVFVNSAQVRFYWPNTQLAPGSYTVQVTNPAAAGGLVGSLASAFTVAAPQPTITSTSPNPVTYGVSPTGSINIFGSGFVVGATITVGSLSGVTVAGSTATAATPFVFVSSAQLRFYWPNTSLVAASYTVEVTNPAAAGGLATTLVGGFTVAAAQLTVVSTSPSSPTYVITPSTAVSIFGTSFLVGATITIASPTTGTTLSGTTVLGSTATAGTPFVHVSSGQLRFYWSNTSLDIGSYTVTVTNPAASGGASATLANGFTVVAPQPTITTVSPSPVTYDVTPSEAISIFGTNFTTGATVTVGTLTGGVCQPGTCLSGTTVSGSQASATVPFVFVSATRLSFYWANTGASALAPAVSYQVQATNRQSAGGLSVSVSNAFTVAPPLPIIQSVTPSTVDFAVTPSQSVVIRGIRFYAPVGADGPVITIGAFTCTAVPGAVATATVPCVYVTNTRLEFYWDNGAISPGTAIPPGSYTVQVTNPAYVGAGTGSLAAGFTIAAPQPHIEKVSPAVVTAGITTSRVVTILGFSDSGFRPGAAVVVGNLSCVAVEGSTPTLTTPCVYVSPTQIKFYWDTDRSVDPTAPLLGPGVHDVRVTNSIANGGLSGILVGGFTVTVDPEILAVEPSTGIGAGALGAVVTITSTGFGSGASVRIGTGGGQDPLITMTSGFRVHAAGDGGTITINVANTAVPGLRDVTLTTPSGLTSGCLTCRVMINPPPVVASVSPALGVGASGMSLAVSGENFDAGALAAATVTLPTGVTGACTVTTSSAIACANVAVAPSVPPGTYALIVTNPDGGRGSGVLTVKAPPVFAAISPNRGTAGSRTAVTITGTGFQTGVTVVMDAEIGVTVTAASATALSADLAIGSTATAGFHPLTLTNPDGGAITVLQAFSVGTPLADALSALATYGQQDLAAVQYQRSSGTGWSGPLAGPSLAAPPVWQVMKANPVRDERILAVVDEQRRLTLHVWNGQAWMGDLQATASTGLLRPTQTVDVAFEQVTGGKGLAVYAPSGSSSLRYRTWDPTALSWSTENYVAGPIEMTGTPLWVRLETRPTTNEILLVYGDSANAVGAAVWHGATQTWTDQVVLTTTAPGHDAPLFDVAFERATGRAIAAWATTNTPSAPHYRIWNGGWGVEATAPSASAAPSKMLTALRLAADPIAISKRIALAASSGTPVGTLAALLWDGTQWSASADLLTTDLAMDGGGRGLDLGWEGASGDQVAVYATRQSPGGVYKTRSPASAWSASPELPLPTLTADPQTTLTPPCLIDSTHCVTITGTTLYVTSTAGFPAAGIVAVDAELIRYTSKTTTSLSGLTRGAFGTTATDHASSAAVALRAFPAWIELAGVRSLDNLALTLFDGAGRVSLARWDGTAWGGALEAQTSGSGFVSLVAGRAVAVTLAQHLAGVGPAITPPTMIADTTPPASPVLTAGSPTTTSVSLSWTAVGDDGMAGGMASRYELRTTRGLVSAVQSISPTQPPGLTETATVTGLQGGTTYTIELRALDEVPNASAWSATVTVTTPVDQPPPAITDLRLGATGPTPNAIAIQWGVPSDDSGPLAGYSVRYSTTPFNSDTFDTAIPYTAHAPQTVGAIATLVIDGLVPNKDYYVGVKAMDAIGQLGALSNVLFASTAAPVVDVAPPARISDLMVFAGATTSTSLLLKWTATGDDGSVGTAGAYEVRYATAPLTATNFSLAAAFPPGPAGSAQELVVSGLSSNTAYYFAIDVIDDGGNHSGFSTNVATGRTALRRGYNMVSVPLVLADSNATADMVFGDDVGLPVYAYRWKSSGLLSTDGCYLGTTACGLLGRIQTGAGYFLYSSGTQAVLDAVGTAVPSSTYNVPLDLGFNMIGNPYGQEIALASVQVKRISTGEIALYAAAVTKKWVGPAIYVYDGVTTQPYGLTDVPPVVLKPWSGVWVQSLVSDAVLVFAHP